MVANMVFETAKDGGCACYMVEDVPDFALYGYGNNPREAKADMLKAYEEIKELLAEEGKKATELEFVYHYDMKSFFDYFNFSTFQKSPNVRVSILRSCANTLPVSLKPEKGNIKNYK